jgi:hypothetical protein
MGIGSSSICVLAVVTSSASPTMTHEEADYYGQFLTDEASRLK